VAATAIVFAFIVRMMAHRAAEWALEDRRSSLAGCRS
jgi:hypothetical protein